MKQIDILPDDVLLEIFDFYTITDPLDDIPLHEHKKAIETWQLLIHVCRRWRSLVLGSPRRLNLRLDCTSKTPVREKLDVWPALPLVVEDWDSTGLSSDTDNIIAALEHCNRICQVDFYLVNLEEVLAPMQVPFPELTDLDLMSLDTEPPVIPDSFLDGSAPRLRHFKLCGILFQGLPKLLLTAVHLVSLSLSDIPDSGYISPEAMVAILSALPALRILSLSLEFQSRQSRASSGWESQSIHQPKRSILPALHKFHFTGVTEYSEEFVTHIDAPQLDELYMTFSNEIDFDCPQLAQFINRSPTLRARDEAHVQFNHYITGVVLPAQSRALHIKILSTGRDRQFSFIKQFCNASLHPLSTVEDLYIEDGNLQLVWKNDVIETTLWLQLLLPFTAVKNLYLSKEFAPGIVAALRDLVGGTTAGVLPSLQNIFVERPEPSGPLPEKIGQFVATRQLSGRPVAISFWDKDSKI